MKRMMTKIIKIKMIKIRMRMVRMRIKMEVGMMMRRVRMGPGKMVIRIKKRKMMNKINPRRKTLKNYPLLTSHNDNLQPSSSSPLSSAKSPTSPPQLTTSSAVSTPPLPLAGLTPTTPSNKPHTSPDSHKSKSLNPLHSPESSSWKTKTPKSTWNHKSSSNPPNQSSKILSSKPNPIRSPLKAKNSSPNFMKKTNASKGGRPIPLIPWPHTWLLTRDQMDLGLQVTAFMEVEKSSKGKSTKRDFSMWTKETRKSMRLSWCSKEKSKKITESITLQRTFYILTKMHKFFFKNDFLS